jgi:hypothetical protein
MKKIYGPFYLGIEKIWHWHKECPSFPDIKKLKQWSAQIFLMRLNFAANCLQLDKKDATDKRNTDISCQNFLG